ncbi:MAG TPA: hypothetical protein VMZ31_10700 [Phycisphaerae bacterium]|nr:hypothetical protein [Phycisphaerae bacterium]
MFREEFWRKGGNASPSAWKAGYKSRLLAEIATQGAEANSAIINEYVETLQSVTPLFQLDLSTNETVANEDVQQMIKDLRLEQFDQIKKEIANGRTPEYCDFVCGDDLIYLLQAPPPHNRQSVEVLEYLQAMSREKGWTIWLDILNRIEPGLRGPGVGVGFNISVPDSYESEKEVAYINRLPSFRGPADRKVKLLEESEP